MTRIVKHVQRFGILYMPTLTYVEVGFKTRLDAEYSLAVYQRASSNPDGFCVVPTTSVKVLGTKEQIEGWLVRDIGYVTAPPLKENLRPKCPVFTPQRWGYMKGANGVDHDPVWFEESALKSKGTNLLKRLTGTKYKPRRKTLEELYIEFLKANPMSTLGQKRKFIKRNSGISNRQAKQWLINRKIKQRELL